ncbi:carboxypeptidase regulatory-like domain-containing protein [bacterium AH-315-P07]|nr:carboxypeptidase regulatory-like domain-containing protein [bacterium AH-315-P07]
MLCVAGIVGCGYGSPNDSAGGPDTGVGDISGRVISATSGDPVSGAMVTLSDAEGTMIEEVVSDSNGQFGFLALPVGAAFLTIANDGFLGIEQRADVIGGVSAQIAGSVIVADTGTATGTAGGTLIDAVVGLTLPNVPLELRAGVLRSVDTDLPVVASTTSDASGVYSFEDLAAGTYTAFADAEGFDLGAFTVFSSGGESFRNQNGSLSPTLPEGQFRIVLEWGETPSDLDSHLTGPDQAGSGRFHMYYADKTPDGSDHVQLDLDDVSSFGPETTTIRQTLPGIYIFSVHDFSNSGSTTSTAMSNSNARITLYTSEGSQIFYITPNITATVWTVLKIDGETGVATYVNNFGFEFEEPEVQSVRYLGATAYGPNAEPDDIFTDLPAK